MTDARLHPRLSRVFATQRYEELSSLEIEMEALREHAYLHDPQETWAAVGAPRIDDSQLQTFADAVRAAAQAHGWPEPPLPTVAVEFDRSLARVLIDQEHLFPAEAVSADVWSHVSLIQLPDVTWWRWHGSTNPERFIASDLTRHAFAKQYWRALAFTRGADDLEEAWSLFDRLGEADFDQLQSRRNAYGVNPELSRALARAYIHLREDGGGAGNRDVWREFLKSVLRIGAFVSFAVLTSDELQDAFSAFAHDAPSGAIAEAPDPTEAGPGPDNGSADGAGLPGDFDAMPLRDVVVHLVDTVRAVGRVAENAIDTAFQQTTGLTVPPSRSPILRGIAWQGAALRYLEHDGDSGSFGLGDTAPAPDRRWREWSLTSFIDHAQTSTADEAELQTELFLGRPNRTVKRIVRAAVVARAKSQAADNR